MAKNKLPQFMLEQAPPPPWMMAGLNPAVQNDVSVMADQGAMNAQDLGKTVPTKVPSDQVAGKQAQKQVKSPWDSIGTGASVGYNSSFLGPQADPYLAEIKRLQGMTEDYRQKSLADQEAGLAEQQKDIDTYSAQKSDIDWRPLASLIDQYTGSNSYRLASDLAPESMEAKRKNIMDMKKQLNASKSMMSKEQYAALKDQLDANLGIIKEMGAEKRQDERLSLELARFNRLGDKDMEAYVQKLAKEVEGKSSLEQSYSTLEKDLGFKIDDFDPSTKTVKGKPIDLPGRNIPGVGRVSFYDEKARRIDDSMSRIFNTELKDRSGAAVTSNELIRLKNEFSSGRFQTEEEKLAALKDYKRELLAEFNRRESAFKPEVRAKLQERQQQVDAKLSGGPQAAPVPYGASAPSGLNEAQQRRLEELRKKLGK